MKRVGGKFGPSKLTFRLARLISAFNKSNVADPGCLSLIRHPAFSIPYPRFRVDKIPDLGPGSKCLILSKIRSGMFLPEPRVKKTGSCLGVPKGSHGAMNPFKEAQEEIISDYYQVFKILIRRLDSYKNSGSGSTIEVLLKIRI